MESRAYIGRVDIDRYFAVFELDDVSEEFADDVPTDVPIRVVAQPVAIESRVPLKPYIHESEILLQNRQFSNHELESASQALRALKDQLDDEFELPQAHVALSPQRHPRVFKKIAVWTLNSATIALTTAFALSQSPELMQSWRATNWSGHFQSLSAQLQQLSQQAKGQWNVASVALENQIEPNHRHFSQALKVAEAAAEATQVATTPEEWQAVAQQWGDAIAHLQAISPDHPLHATAQPKLKFYETAFAYASQEIDSFREGVNMALQAAQLVQTAHSQTDWQQVIYTWQEALELMQAVPSSSPHYPQAQEKVAEYAANVVYAQTRLTKLKQ